MKIIVFGCGKIGTTIIERLSGEGHDLVAIDKNPEVLEHVCNRYDIIGFCSGGVDSEAMIEAGVPKSQLFVAATESDDLNMLSCFLARKMGAEHTIARVRNPEYNDESLGFMKQHLDLSATLNPELLTAHEIYNILRLPTALKVETFSNRNIEIVELPVGENSPFIGLTLSDLRRQNHEKFLVCNVVRGDEVFIPDGNFTLMAGDKVGLTASRMEIIKLLKKFGMLQKQPKSVIIMGAGRITYYLAKLLIHVGVTVKIIEKDKDVCLKTAAALPEAILICGDGMQQDVLLEEGMDVVDGFVSLTGTDEENILSAFYAADLKVSSIITKINRPELLSTAKRLGLACIVSPQKTVADVMSRYARALENSLGSSVETLHKLSDGQTEVLEFKVRPEFPYSRILLRDMKLKKNILIAGIIRGRKPIIPTGDDMILPNDRVIVVAAGHQFNELSDIVRREER